jgi:hypothetical protein
MSRATCSHRVFEEDNEEEFSRAPFEYPDGNGSTKERLNQLVHELDIRTIFDPNAKNSFVHRGLTSFANFSFCTKRRSIWKHCRSQSRRAMFNGASLTNYSLVIVLAWNGSFSPRVTRTIVVWSRFTPASPRRSKEFAHRGNDVSFHLLLLLLVIRLNIISENDLGDPLLLLVRQVTERTDRRRPRK